MKFIIIADSHTKKHLDYIYQYLHDKKWKIQGIIINGDILGENEVREKYGYGYNKSLFHASLDKKNILHSLVPSQAQQFLQMISYIDSGDDKKDLTYAPLLRSYVVSRYAYVEEMLLKFSKLAPVFFNIGTFESPLHYKVLNELAFLLDVKESMLRRIALLSDYRDVYTKFCNDIKKLNAPIHLVGSTAKLYKSILIAGIPGYHKVSGESDSLTRFQKKIITETLSSIKRNKHYAKHIILLNQTQGVLTKNPFSFQVSDNTLSSFLKHNKTIFIQSYYHFMTTHFYQRDGSTYIHTNAAVNNGLFNAIDIGNKMKCFDIDPYKDIIRELHIYEHETLKSEDRLKKNYEDAPSIIDKRSLKGCFYM